MTELAPENTAEDSQDARVTAAPAADGTKGADEVANAPAASSGPATDEFSVVSANEAADQSAPSASLAQQIAAVVKGRIQVEDEVVEKVAGLAAMQVDGVADLGGDVERTLETVREHMHVGHKREGQGVRATISNKTVAVDLTIVIEYGHVVTEVAKAVKANVARSVNQMLRLRVVEVNVTVDDVKMPEKERPKLTEPEGYGETDDGY